MILEVAYDLHNPGRDYARIGKLLESADGGWAHPQGSVWFIDTIHPPISWIEALKKAGDANDEYLVTRVRDNEWASFNTDAKVVAWLQDGRRRW